MKLKFLDDDSFFEEQLPRYFEIKMIAGYERNRPIVNSYYNGKSFGNTLSDNNYINDFYRYHDIFHLSYAAVLGWSPVVRKLMGRQRKSCQEDAIKFQKMEEIITAYTFSMYEINSHLDEKTIVQVMDFVRESEAKIFSINDWKQTIDLGFSTWQEMQEKKSGIIEVNLYHQSLSIRRL